MRIAIISDIHANKHALDLVLKDIERKGVDKIVCLGDLVTKYFYPDYCVDAVRANSDLVIMGNCDERVVNNPNFAWARGKLKSEGLEYLSSLPKTGQIEIGKAIINLYHSNPKDLIRIFHPLIKVSINRTNDDKGLITDYNEMFSDDKPSTSIVGHAHMPYISVEKDGKLEIDPEEPDRKIILPGDRAVINPGSVGETIEYLNKDKLEEVIRPELTYAILDDKGLEQGYSVQIVRVPYKETFRLVVEDSIDKQIIGRDNGGFPYSPNDTEYRVKNVINQNPELEEDFNKRLDEMKKVEAERKAKKAELEAKKKELEMQKEAENIGTNEGPKKK